MQNASGSSGVVFLEFNAAKDRMMGAAYGQGQMDVWDVSATDGTLKLRKQIPSTGSLGPNPDRQTEPHPHQVLLEPSGRFFVVNDLGTDSLIVIDSADDAFEVVNNHKVPNPGCGPRHGAFYPVGAEKATHYMVVCEITSQLVVFEVSYAQQGNLTFTPAQIVSTFGASFPPANQSSAAAAEIAISNDNASLYISNRLTGNATDSIAHFAITKADTGAVSVAFADTVSSGGLVPRMFSLSADEAEEFLFAANQDGASGLLAIERSTVSGALGAPVSSLGLEVFGPSGFGPQFVKEIVPSSA